MLDILQYAMCISEYMCVCVDCIDEYVCNCFCFACQIITLVGCTKGINYYFSWLLCFFFVLNDFLIYFHICHEIRKDYLDMLTQNNEKCNEHGIFTKF